MKSSFHMPSHFLYSRTLDFFRALVLPLALLSISPLLTSCDSAATGPDVDPDAQIVLLSPVGGEHYTAGQIVHVKWKTQGKGDEEINAANIFLSPDSGKTWIGLLKGSIGLGDSLWGDYAWPVPQELIHLGVTWDFTDNHRVMMKVMQYATGDANKIAVTRKTFSITAK